ncbi:MAG: radical SAM protein [Clostridia bacterium]|nr:radical SAM protein [Clostridia bacterium]
MPLRLYGTADESYVDGPGIRYVIFVQGCPHRCPGCHNPLSHDPSGGTPVTADALWAKIDAMNHLDGVTFSGGEPFTHAAALAEIGRLARAKGLTVMTYSGYTYEKLLAMAETDDAVRDLLTVTNYLVDGPFILAERDLSLRFRGSRNQRILDVTCYPNSDAAAEVNWK